MYLLGYDIGSSSIKAALIDADSKRIVDVSKYPKTEMDILCQSEGWAEQDPELWWKNLCIATDNLFEKSKISTDQILSIGISYQMHGLVLVDKDQNVLRPSIIWCDNRAVEIGKKAFMDIGEDYCLNHYLNSPGNFTVSKLKWVRDNEFEIYNKIQYVMLPGDFIAMKLTGDINTTVSGLSEGILWDFKENCLANNLMEYYGFDKSIIPPIVDNFTVQAKVCKTASKRLGLKHNTPVTYRAGDQVNNAMSLSVNKPGELAATGGTSGVAYAIAKDNIFDKQLRINSFAHVNHTVENPRIGLLMCINGAGIQYSWLKNQIAREGIAYPDIEKMISSIPIGSEGLRVLPFGNGAERILNHLSPGAQINNLQFNKHTRIHLYRAALEGVAFSFVYGINILNELGLDSTIIRVGNDNLFQSDTFSNTIANLLDLEIEVLNTTGAAGAAIASGIGIGKYGGLEEAFNRNHIVKTIGPNDANVAYHEAYELWRKDLGKLIST